AYFVEWRSAPDDQTLGVVDFSIFPHLDHAMMPGNTLADAERWAAGIAGPAYAIDDETALKVVDGVVDVVSEGRWKRFAHYRQPPVCTQPSTGETSPSPDQQAP